LCGSATCFQAYMPLASSAPYEFVTSSVRPDDVATRLLPTHVCRASVVHANAFAATRKAQANKRHGMGDWGARGLVHRRLRRIGGHLAVLSRESRDAPLTPLFVEITTAAPTVQSRMETAAVLARRVARGGVDGCSSSSSSMGRSNGWVGLKYAAMSKGYQVASGIGCAPPRMVWSSPLMRDRAPKLGHLLLNLVSQSQSNIMISIKINQNTTILK